MRFKLTLAALAATAAFASPAMAQTVVADGDPQARGVVLSPLTLTKLADLNFGTVLVDNLNGGTVTINADTGNRTFGGAGGVTPVASDAGNRGSFQGTGDAGEQVILTLTPPAGNVLGGPGTATIAVTSFVLDSAGASGASRTIPTGDTFIVGVGGTFAIAADQANGVYTADFTLTAQYP
jgi:hypothetical protein